MRYLPNASQMKEADQYTILHCQTTSMILMERAALSFVEYMGELNVDLSRICVVCGTGNNGGDGIAIARILTENGCAVRTVLAGEESKCTEETRRQIDFLKEAGGVLSNSFAEDEYSIIVDALFGVGLNREVEGDYASLIGRMNAAGGKKIAVDIPSGISADSGAILGAAFQADITVTFQAAKPGLYLYPGREYAGQVIVRDIGISEKPFKDDQTVMCQYDAREYKRLLPVRKADSNKGTCGKVLCIAGSRGMAGAAYLSAKAAYLAGAGLVRIYTPKENRVVLQQLLPEAIVTTYDFYDEPELKQLLNWADVVSAGPGIGTSERSRKILKTVLENVAVPCVLDADALNLIADHRKYLRFLDELKVILTPHMGEMARLLGCTVEELRRERIPMLGGFVKEYGAACVLKDAKSIVMTSGGRPCMNPSGNAAMAKAGSGDVLTGIITGLMAQGVPLNDAGVLGTYLHGLAGDCAKESKGSYGVLASDLLESLCTVMKEQES